ncbi:hypothetical protein [Bacillus sp. 2205SS5-2]|uniref:hypothetical protein n=1 Tax=Bacillus sp. 2205SS5-2 TaxID=3109031 RepID=UPI003006C514
MKNNGQASDFLYVHTKSAEKYAVTSGINFSEFAATIPTDLQHILLLQHQVEFPSFHFSTHFDYLMKEDFPLLFQESDKRMDFSWIDFEDLVGLDELSGEEVAELLYLSHMKKPLHGPFFNRLNNHYMYLSYHEGLITQTYYRDFNDFYSMLSGVVVNKLFAQKSEKKLFSKKSVEVAPIPIDLLKLIEERLNEGVVFSILNSTVSRGKVQIPFWTIGDYQDMNEMRDEYVKLAKQDPSGMLLYDRREKEWHLFLT